MRVLCVCVCARVHLYMRTCRCEQGNQAATRKLTHYYSQRMKSGASEMVSRTSHPSPAIITVWSLCLFVPSHTFLSTELERDFRHSNGKFQKEQVPSHTRCVCVCVCGYGSKPYEVSHTHMHKCRRAARTQACARASARTHTRFNQPHAMRES